MYDAMKLSRCSMMWRFLFSNIIECKNFKPHVIIHLNDPGDVRMNAMPNNAQKMPTNLVIRVHCGNYKKINSSFSAYCLMFLIIVCCFFLEFDQIYVTII